MTRARYWGDGRVDNGPPPDDFRPELSSPPPPAPADKELSQIKIVSGEFYQIETLINKQLNSGWKLRGRLRKKIGETYFQVMYK